MPAGNVAGTTDRYALARACWGRSPGLAQAGGRQGSLGTGGERMVSRLPLWRALRRGPKVGAGVPEPAGPSPALRGFESDPGTAPSRLAEKIGYLRAVDIFRDLTAE